MTFTVYGLTFPFTVYSMTFTVYGLTFTVYGLRFTVRNAPVSACVFERCETDYFVFSLINFFFSSVSFVTAASLLAEAAFFSAISSGNLDSIS